MVYAYLIKCLVSWGKRTNKSDPIFSGFHTIPIKDKLRVAATPEFKEWLQSSTWEQAADMVIREADAYGDDLGDIFNEMIDEIKDLMMTK